MNGKFEVSYLLSDDEYSDTVEIECDHIHLIKDENTIAAYGIKIKFPGEIVKCKKVR